MQILSSILHAKQGINIVCDTIEKIQIFRDKPHYPVYYINGKVFGNDCKGNCRRCNAHLQMYFEKSKYDLLNGIRYYDM